jgi:adenylate cyclase
LERYVSKNLVKEILENPDSYYSSLRGVRVPATILFSDLIGFTTLSEKADPEALVSQLNEYLSRMTSVVFRNGGTLDKFIGDAIMAVWGNVRSFGMAQDTKACVRAALGMRRELRQLNQKWREEGRMGLGMGIGINQGEVVVGNIGSHGWIPQLLATPLISRPDSKVSLEFMARIFSSAPRSLNWRETRFTFARLLECR